MHFWIALLAVGFAIPALADAYQTASNAQFFEEIAAACGGEGSPGVEPAMVMARKGDRDGYAHGINAGSASWKDMLSSMSLKQACVMGEVIYGPDGTRERGMWLPKKR